MLASKCLLVHGEANIAVDYPALDVAADYPARTMPKLKYIYTTEIRSESRRQAESEINFKTIDWYLSNCYL